jgi:hypothetical protein
LPAKYKNKLPTHAIVPFDATSHINTGKPDWFPKKVVHPYKKGGKVGIIDTIKLKYHQCMWYVISSLLQQMMTVSLILQGKTTEIVKPHLYPIPNLGAMISGR